MPSRTSPVSVRFLLVALCASSALALAAAASVRADDVVPTRLARPNALRATGMVQAGGVFSGQLWDSYAGLTYARQLDEPLALEVTGGLGRGGTRRGGHAGAGLRVSVAGRSSSALTVGAGGHVAFLPTYGPVAFSHLELAWELRTPSGFDLVLGGGLGVTLTTSRATHHRCLVEGNWLGCPDQRFHAGDTGLTSRLELGWAF